MMKLEKALYCLKQAPMAWYERLSGFLLTHAYKRGKISNNLFLKTRGMILLIIQVCIDDDIIFCTTANSLCQEFKDMMRSEFEISTIGELNFLLGLQIKKAQTNTFISEEKYIRDLLKKYQMMDTKPIDTPIGTSSKLDTEALKVNVTIYKGIIGSLLYLIANKADIVLSVCMYARFQAFQRNLI